MTSQQQKTRKPGKLGSPPGVCRAMVESDVVDEPITLGWSLCPTMGVEQHSLSTWQPQMDQIRSVRGLLYTSQPG